MSLTQENNLKEDSKSRQLEEFLPRIKYLAKRLSFRLPPQIDEDDLVNAGTIGFLDAIEKFDQSRGIKLQTYAEYRIRGAMIDEIRSLDWVPRSVRQKVTLLQKTYKSLEIKFGRAPNSEEVAQNLNLSSKDYEKLLLDASPLAIINLEDMDLRKEDLPLSSIDKISLDKENPFSLHEINEQKDLLAKIIEALPEKEKLVISLYYFNELTLKEIGQVLDISESRVCQIHTQAILRLKSKLKKIWEE